MASTEYPHVEIIPGTRSGKPLIAGSRIAVSDVVTLHVHMGQALTEIANTYDLPLAAVYASIAYYYDHQAEIDQRMAEAETRAEQLRSQTLSPLQRKLQAVKHG